MRNWECQFIFMFLLLVVTAWDQGLYDIVLRAFDQTACQYICDLQYSATQQTRAANSMLD